MSVFTFSVENDKVSKLTTTMMERFPGSFYVVARVLLVVAMGLRTGQHLYDIMVTKYS